MKGPMMRAFSPAPHPGLMEVADHLRVPSIDLSRAAMIVLLVAVAVGGMALREAAPTAGEEFAPLDPGASASPSAAAAAAAVLPRRDAPGADLKSLPRYPGSVRVGYDATRDDRLRRVGAGFLTDASVDDVRAFYQEVTARSGWQRADIDYTDGGWTYVLVRKTTEALVIIEPANGLVVVRIEVSRPIPVAAPSSPPAVQPAAPPPDNGGSDDDDDDDDDGGDDDDSGGDD
jgi:hypothetical protein